MLLGLVACTSTSHVLVGSPRAPISPRDVQVYWQPPPKYEQIAILDTSSGGSFGLSEQAKADKVVERLKEEAAKLGANGILIQALGERPSGSVGFGFGSATPTSGVGMGTSTASYEKTGNGVAIYVAPN
jgi:hypothetical protein